MLKLSSVISSSDVMRSLSNIASPSLNSELSSEPNACWYDPEAELFPLELVLNEDGGALCLKVKGLLLLERNFPAFDSRIDARLTDPNIFAKGPSRTAILNPRMKTH